MDCELRLVNPSVVLINTGYNDITMGIDPATFQGQLETAIQIALDNNVIPIVATVYPIPGYESQSQSINEAIISAADNKNVPVFNQWRAFNELSGSGLDGSGDPSVAPEGDDYLSPNTIAGANTRNRYTLLLLESLAATFFN
jgi:lysophospholipase L1-like esterase